jgi:hypothetical protein
VVLDVQDGRRYAVDTVGGIGVGDAASAFFGFWAFGLGSVPPGDVGAFFFRHTILFREWK